MFPFPIYNQSKRFLQMVFQKRLFLFILALLISNAAASSKRCDSRNPFNIQTNALTETCKDVAFLRYDRKAALIAQNIRSTDIVSAVNTATEFYEAFSKLQHITFRDQYVSFANPSGGWRYLNCDMVIEKETIKKDKISGFELVGKACNKVSKYLYGTTLYGPTCTTSRRGIESRGGDREIVRACPVELVCPYFSQAQRFLPLSKIEVIGSDDFGIESLRPTCYSSNFKRNNLAAKQTHVGFQWMQTQGTKSEIGCGPNGVDLGFINGVEIKISPNRNSGNGINAIRFSCSDGTAQGFMQYLGSTTAITLEEQKCARGKVAVGIFQFTREGEEVYGTNNDKGEKGLLDVSLYCDYLQCPLYFEIANDHLDNTYCTLIECSCPNGKPQDADCRALDEAAKEALQQTSDCAKENLCLAGEEKCASCDLGYFLDNKKCKKIAPSTCSFGTRVLSCADAAPSDPYCLVPNTVDSTQIECVELKNSMDQSCLLKNNTEACNSCDDGFQLVVSDDVVIGQTYCNDINECLPGGVGEQTCNLLQKTCRNTLGSFSCDLECNTATSYKVNDTSIPGGLEVCECKQNYYRDSPSVVDRVMGIDKNDFCVTCVDFEGLSEEPLCSGHGQCVAPLVPFARPVCACDPNYGGTGCEIKLTKTFTCNDLLRFECVPDPALVNDLQLQPELLLGHGWRCETLQAASTTFAPADVSLDISAISFSRVRLYDDEQKEVATETFCLLAHLHVQQLGLEEARVRLAPDQDFDLSFVQWTGAQVETSVRWGAAQGAFEAAEDGGLQLALPPTPLQLVEPDVSWWALEPAGLCPFPFNTDVFRGNNEGYLFAPCSPPDPQSESEGWFFLAQAVPGEANSTVGCFLLDASARGKDLAVVTDAQFRCAGYVTDVAGEPHSSIDCLLKSPLLVPLIPTSTTVEERGLWVKEQCL